MAPQVISPAGKNKVHLCLSTRLVYPVLLHPCTEEPTAVHHGTRALANALFHIGIYSTAGVAQASLGFYYRWPEQVGPRGPTSQEQQYVSNLQYVVGARC